MMWPCHTVEESVLGYRHDGATLPMSLLTQYAQAPEIHFMLSQSDCARMKDEPADFNEEGTSRSET